MRPLLFVSAVTGLLLGLPLGHADELPDLGKLDRSLLKEPAYVSKNPLYCLAAFGPKAEKAIWLILDQSQSESGRYDVLYIDRNGDGDLTDPIERLTVGPEGRFRLAEFKDPATGVQHGEFTLRTLNDDPQVILNIAWRGQFRLGGGYPEDPETGYLRFAPRPAEAPVLWIHGDGPFRFQRWYSGQLTIGGADDFKVFLGQPGRGENTFCAAQEHILPDGEWVRATLLYRDGMGKEQRLVCELRERC